MKIAVDVMGFENDISEAVYACESFLKYYHDVEIILVGDETKITPFLKNDSSNKISVCHAEQFVTQDDSVLSLRTKNNSSMQITANLLKDGKVDGLLSAGNTAIFVYIMYATIGMLDGVSKLGFMPTIPTVNNKCFNLIDVGASIDVTADDLVKFALMASVYAQQRTFSDPKVAILNIGTEHHKGRQLERDTDKLIKSKTKLNYVGFVESRNLLDGVADVVVTDGFSGNLVLKSLEGTAKSISKFIKKEYRKPWNIFGKLTSILVFKKLKSTFDYKQNAGAFVLGLNKICVKTHGSADKQQFYSSLTMLYNCIKNNVLNKIATQIKKYNHEEK